MLYTDGITEAQDAGEDFFDEERLRDVARANGKKERKEKKMSIEEERIRETGRIKGRERLINGIKGKERKIWTQK